MVRENLRQACVFNVTTAKKQQFRWWKYVRIFNEECKRGIARGSINAAISPTLSRNY